MSSTSSRRFLRMQWRLHKLVWNLSGGRLGRRVSGMPVLELVTIGHRSGQERGILIWYVSTARGPAVIGSNAGASYDPAWVKNLRAHPGARIRRDGTWSDVRARFAAGAEFEEIWQKAVEAADDYAGYAAVTDRPIPVVVLEPA
ncbi:MAG: nitroreductase/quinone reductase family protein [Acidimicrobiia bacterium]